MSESRRGTVRVAGIDLGSNTTRLHVADVGRAEDGSMSLKTISRHSTVTRLAEQVDARGILLPQAIARTRNALADYRRILRDEGAVFALVGATSAVRDADNGESFLGEVEYTYGFRTELLSGSDEAHTGFRGVTSDATLWERTRTGSSMSIDIGGGSTEFVLAHDGAIVDHESLQLGSVRITERFLDGHDPHRPDDVLRAVQYVADTLAARFPAAAHPDVAIGVAGTVTTVASFALGLETYDPRRTHLASVPATRVSAEVVRLSRMTIAERELVPCLEPKRAPVIVGGLIILECAMRHFGVTSLTASERDILDGIALRAGEIAIDEGISELPEPFGRTNC